MTAFQVRARLMDLHAERAQALTLAAAPVQAVLDDLDSEIAQTEAVYVGIAVTEIATLRGELFGRQSG